MRTTRKSRHYVIIGNSAAALSAIGAIRRNDGTAPVTVIAAETCFAYSPVLLTYYMAGRISRQQVFLTDDDYYRSLDVCLKRGDPVSAIDVNRRMLTLRSGQHIDYDRLLIATGSSAKQLDGSGNHLPGVFTIKTLTDADRILEHTAERKRIAIVGGGLIGLQAANALADGDRDIRLLIGSERPLSQNVDGDCSRFVTECIQGSGLSAYFETGVERIEADKGELRLVLNDGGDMSVDAVIVGKGVKPNIELAKHAGIEVDWGVVVDERMQTSAPEVYAAGDVAQGFNQASGERQVVATWVNACIQGKTAGTNMSGGQAACTGLSGNVCRILGNSVASVGVTHPDPVQHHWQSYTAPDGAYYRNIIFGQEDEIAGAVMMGSVSDIGLIRNMIQNRVRVSARLKEKIVHGPISYGDLYGCCLKKV